MKQINTYIDEKLRLTAKQKYTCQPKDKYELKQIIIDRIKDEGPNCDLNDIDVSKITDMSILFHDAHNSVFKNFNGDVSQWNVSNVTNMQSMFLGCEQFNCDLSRWDVSNVENMRSMFSDCREFNCDISRWDVSNVKEMQHMFDWCTTFNCDLSMWDVSNVENMNYMFYNCNRFNQDLNDWDVSKVTKMFVAFRNCPTQPKWYDKDKWED